jgi:hypothetical protein
MCDNIRKRNTSLQGIAAATVNLSGGVTEQPLLCRHNN